MNSLSEAPVQTKHSKIQEFASTSYYFSLRKENENMKDIFGRFFQGILPALRKTRCIEILPRHVVAPFTDHCLKLFNQLAAHTLPSAVLSFHKSAIAPEITLTEGRGKKGKAPIATLDTIVWYEIFVLKSMTFEVLKAKTHVSSFSSPILFHFSDLLRGNGAP